MNKIFILALILAALSGCGYSATNSEVIGQVKKVMHNTPLICPDYNDADVSLGVMRNGTGSMSTQDQWYYIPDARLLDEFKKANESGSLVKITYSVKRVSLCVSDHQVTAIEVLK